MSEDEKIIKLETLFKLKDINKRMKLEATSEEQMKALNKIDEAIIKEINNYLK